MANTRQIKRRILSAQNISKITGAMEKVAASKMVKAQSQALEARPYARALAKSLQTVAKYTERSLHPLLSKHDLGIEVLVIVSTDKGLCGSLNTNIFKQVMHWKSAHPTGKFIAVGKKAAMFARFSGIDLEAQFTEIPEKIVTNDIVGLTELIIQKFLDKSYKSVDIAYTDFINTLSQQATIAPLLPIEPSYEFRDDTMVVPEISPQYVFEPSATTLLEELLPYYLEHTVYQLFLEAKASEQSARMVAMKNASENANELVGELKLLFNKSRQAAITNELLEITTATLSLTA